MGQLQGEDESGFVSASIVLSEHPEYSFLHQRTWQ
jgi:hypothetical protein